MDICEARAAASHTLLHHVAPLNDGNCEATIPFKDYARDALHHTYNIGMLKSNKKNSVPLVFMANIVTRAQLRYTRYYLTPGICSLIEMHLWQICNHVDHVCFFYVCIWHVYWILAFEAIQLKLELETNYATTQVLAYRHYICIKETWGCVRDMCIQIHAYHIVSGLHWCR